MRELPVHLTLLNWGTSFDYVKKIMKEASSHGDF
jgi:hypothetical protein